LYISRSLVEIKKVRWSTPLNGIFQKVRERRMWFFVVCYPVGRIFISQLFETGATAPGELHGDYLRPLSCFLTSKNIETLKYRFETLKYRLGSLSVIGYSVDRMQASTRHALYLWPNLVSFPR